MSRDGEMDVDVPSEEGYEPVGPRPILKLSKDVINKIAAAEIIHRPSNAIKELIENSLDAGSTSIKLTLKEGGLKLIQITDNGHGIRREDLPLLCTRYATSKLRKFDDLNALTTYGFRGEALASISYCSHVEVVTKTREDGCGWKALYSNGELVPPKAGASADPRPAAANDGTMISAEDLFFNMPTRKRAFKSASEEYNRILDVVTKYAVHNPHVAWVCKKAGASLPDISTSPGTVQSNISLLYTPSLAKELLEVKETILQPADKLGAKCRGWVSSANANWARRGGWLLFINNRLVESSKIKKAIDSLYTAFLPKGASPWAYLSLDIDSAKVDVNVHPTKSEVHFLNEDEMVEAIVAAVHASLAHANTSRSFKVQTILPGAPESEKRSETIRKPAPNYKVRMDPSNRTLDAMIGIQNPSQVKAYSETLVGPSETHGGDGRPAKRRALGATESLEEPLDLEDDEREDEEEAAGPSTWIAEGSGTKGKGKAREIPESVCEFASIQELRRMARKRGDADMTEIMQKHAFVGVVDRVSCQSLIQHSTKLYLVNHATVADEHFYQLALRQFGALHRLRLEPAPDLRELIRLAAEDEPGIRESGMQPDEVVEAIYKLLLEKRDMIDEYFSLLITKEGTVETLPMLLRDYTPDLDRLPHFLLCLGTRVDWTSEKECFHAFLRELGFFYSPRLFAEASTVGNIDDEGAGGRATKEEVDHQAWQLEHVLFPSFRRYTTWPKEMMGGGTVRQLANLPDLFRIFERC